MDGCGFGSNGRMGGPTVVHGSKVRSDGPAGGLAWFLEKGTFVLDPACLASTAGTDGTGGLASCICRSLHIPPASIHA